MAPIWSLIKDLNPSKTSWALKLRVVRLYEVRYPNQSEASALGCVLHDQEGLRIHATINSVQMDAFRSLLNEGQLIAIKNLIVSADRMPFKTTNNKFKLLFFKRTHAFEFFDHSFPSLIYDFQQFPEFLDVDNLDQTRLFDFIGKIVDPGTTKNVACRGHGIKIWEIILEDIEKNQLKCTLWEEYVEIFNNLLEKHNKRPLILILQLFRGKKYEDTVALCTAYNVSKMILNEDVPEINESRNQLGEDDDCIHYNERSITISSSTKTPTDDGSSNEEEVIKTIDQLIEDKEIGFFWVFGEIVDVESVGSWSYLSCKRCLKKINPSGDGFFCQKCTQTVGAGKLRYKVRVRVVDETGTTLFLIWDRECTYLIGKTAGDLATKTAEGTAVGSLPPEIEELVDKKLFFKVQVKEDQIGIYNGAYSVVKISKDVNFISNQEEPSSQSANNDDIEQIGQSKKVTKIL